MLIASVISGLKQQKKRQRQYFFLKYGSEKLYPPLSKIVNITGYRGRTIGAHRLKSQRLHYTNKNRPCEKRDLMKTRFVSRFKSAAEYNKLDSESNVATDLKSKSDLIACLLISRPDMFNCFPDGQRKRRHDKSIHNLRRINFFLMINRPGILI